MNDQRLILDAWIDLTGICDDAGWHSASAIAALTELGIAARDAECFIDYVFAQHTAVSDGAELTPEQAARLKRE